MVASYIANIAITMKPIALFVNTISTLHVVLAILLHNIATIVYSSYS